MITLIITKLNLVMHLYIRYTSTFSKQWTLCSQNSGHRSTDSTNGAIMGAIMGGDNVIRLHSDVRYDSLKRAAKRCTAVE